MFGLVKKKSENFKVFTLSSDYKIREKCAALKKKWYPTKYQRI